MNVFRAEVLRRSARLALAATAWAAVSLGAAQAQVPAQQPLPAAREPAPASPRSLAPRRLAPPAAKPAAPAVPLAASGIQVNPLEQVDPDSVGLLTVAEGGFPADLWKGTPYAIVAPLLQEFPTAQASPTLRSLSRRLLLSAAQVPAGEHETGTFIARRAELLARMGDIESARRLIEAAPSHVSSEPLSWAEMNVHLLAADDARACQVVNSRITGAEMARWQKAYIFCQAIAGEKDKAALGLSLLRDIGENDRTFLLLADALVNGTQVTLENLPQPTPLTLAMVRRSGVKLPADALASAQPALLRSLAYSPSQGLEERLDAAELAVIAGAMPVEALRDIYSGVSFQPAELAAPLKTAASLSGPKARALLYQTTAAERNPTAKAEGITQAFKLGYAHGRFTMAARTFAVQVGAIPASAEHVWFAPQAIRALLLSDAPDSALPWVDVVRSAARFRQEDDAVLTRLSPLLHVAGMAEGDAFDALGKWRAMSKSDENAFDQATMVFSLLDAIGAVMPLALWAQIIEGTPRDVATVPRPPIWVLLDRAGPAGQLGGGVLAAIVSLGEGGVVEASPLVLHRVISTLQSLKLFKEARQLAVEAAIEAGL